MELQKPKKNLKTMIAIKQYEIFFFSGTDV